MFLFLVGLLNIFSLEEVRRSYHKMFKLWIQIVCGQWNQMVVPLCSQRFPSLILEGFITKPYEFISTFCPPFLVPLKHYTKRAGFCKSFSNNHRFIGKCRTIWKVTILLEIYLFFPLNHDGRKVKMLGPKDRTLGAPTMGEYLSSRPKVCFFLSGTLWVFLFFGQVHGVFVVGFCRIFFECSVTNKRRNCLVQGGPKNQL